MRAEPSQNVGGGTIASKRTVEPRGVHIGRKKDRWEHLEELNLEDVGMAKGDFDRSSTIALYALRGENCGGEKRN